MALRVSVVGGGIGGMVTALALHRAGLDVTVYERAPALGEIGAGVQLTPNGIRVLERLGLVAALVSNAVPFDTASTYYRMDGTAVGPVVNSDSSGRYPVSGAHRADILGVLAGALPPGAIKTGYGCVSFSQTDSAASLRFENGEVVESDIVVGADGIQSTVQQYVVEPTLPVHSGSVAYRGLLPTSLLPDWPRSRFELWMGEGKHLITFPVRGNTLINYVGFVPSFDAASESWSAPGDPDRLRAEFAGWNDRVEQLLSQVENTFWWGLYDREPLARWTVGRLTLLGDAAHPMLPHVGQGANQAIEDAVALAATLKDASPADAPERLLSYERLRRDRTTNVQSGARRNGNRYDSRNEYEDPSVRDTEILDSQGFRFWLYDYDAEAAADRYIAQQRN